MNTIEVTPSGALSGRIAIVTGSTRGIGRSIAVRFIAEGACVIVHGRTQDSAAQIASGLGANALGVGGDISQPTTAQALVDAALNKWGRIDIVVNNAGIARDAFLTRVTDGDWDETLAVNLGGPFRLTRAAVPHMKSQGKGSIVNVISYAGIRGNAGQAAYSASKAGLVGLTLAAAKELARFSIRVNALAPSALTDMTRQLDEETLKAAARSTPLGRIGTLEEAAEAALFLASDRSSFTTGQIINVDGGFHLK